MFVNDAEEEQARHAAIGIVLGGITYLLLGFPLLIAVLITLLYWGSVIGYEVWGNKRQYRRHERRNR